MATVSKNIRPIVVEPLVVSWNMFIAWYTWAYYDMTVYKYAYNKI